MTDSAEQVSVSESSQVPMSSLMDAEWETDIHPDSDADQNVNDLSGEHLGDLRDQQYAPQDNDQADSQQAEGEGEGEEEGKSPMVTLSDGTELSMDELQSGYMMQRDYTHKTEQLAAHRREFEQTVNLYEQGIANLQAREQALEKFIESLIPPEINMAMMQQDPQTYMQQKALRDQAIKELEQVKSTSAQTKAENNAFQAQRLQARINKEEFLLMNAVPKLRDPKHRAEYIQWVSQSARDFGFSDQELGNVYDHRVLQLLHYAGIGRAAERNANNAKSKAAQVPTKTNSQGQRRGKHVGVAKGSKAASQRFNQTRELEDAMALDIDI